MPLPHQHTTSATDNQIDSVSVKKLPTTQMPYPLEKLESNVAQTWSSLELLSQDFAQMWDQIEKLESIMSLQRQIISTVDQPSSYNSPPLNSSPSIRPYESASFSMNPKPSSGSEQPHQQRQFLYSIQLPPETAEVEPSATENLAHYSWSEFFNMPSTNESSIDSGPQFSQYSRPLAPPVTDHRNNLNKGDIPAIRFQTYCDDGTITGDNASCVNRFQHNIDLTDISKSHIDFSSDENSKPFDDTTFTYKSIDSTFNKQRADSTSDTFDDYLACKGNKQSSPSYSTAYHLPKSHSSLSLDNTFKDNLLYQTPSAHTYYSPQPKRRSTSSSSQSPRVGYSCPVLDSCTNLNAVSPSSSNSYISRATECSSLPRSDYCSPVDSRYTNPFLHDSFNDVRIGGETVDQLIGDSNFIIRPSDHIVGQFENVINILEQYQAEPSPPDSPPPPAPQDNHSYFYQPGNSYCDYYQEEELRYEYVEPVTSSGMALDTIDDSDPEDIISKINHMYETEFQNSKSNHLYNTWNTPHTTSTYQSQINDETLDLIDRLQENMQLRNALASSKYKSWTNIQQDNSLYHQIPPLAEYATFLPTLPDKSSSRYQSAGPEQFHQSRLSSHLISNQPISNMYDSNTYNFKNSRKRLQTNSSMDPQTYSAPQTMFETGSHISSVYSLAGAGNDQYTTVFTSGVPTFEATRPHTPDLLGSGRQRALDKYEMAKNFPTHSYKPEDIPPSTKSVYSHIVPHTGQPNIQRQLNDSITTTVPSALSNRHHRLPSQSQFIPNNTTSSSSNTTGILQRRIFETNPSGKSIPSIVDAKGKPQEQKKSRRGTLRSAFSTVGTSVSHWIPNLQHLAHRRHSFPTPSPMSDEFSSSSATTGSPKKKKHSIISVMTGIFHKSHKSNSFNSSDESDSMVAWNNMAVNHHTQEDIFPEPTYRNQFPDLTKGIKNVSTYPQTSPAPSIPSKRPSLVIEESKSLSVALKTDEQQQHQQKQLLSDLNDEEKPDLAYETAETPTLAQPIISEALAAKYAMNPVIAIDSFEENEICDIEDDHSIATTTESKTPEVSITPKRYALPKQFSLDVSPGFQNDDYKEDSKSNHSWCSAMSKTSSRRQSTEESIDTEDEWYMYECRKLENMEQQNSFERESPATGIFTDRADNTVDMQEFSIGQHSEDFKFDLEVWPEEPKLEDIAEDSIKVGEFTDYETAETTFPKSTEKNSPNFLADGSEIISSEPIEYDVNECEIEEIVLPTDETEENEEMDASKEEGTTECMDENKVEEKKEPELSTTNEETGERMPGTPSLPRFRYDKSESGESPHASKEEISKDGLGSKWKLLKALKERKAEEKSKEAEPPPPAVSILKICIA